MEDERGGWFWLENKIINDHAKALGPIGVAVYALLACRANESQECFPSRAHIAETLGIADGSVRKYLRLLTELKLIRVEPRRDAAGDAAPNHYHLCRRPSPGVRHQKPHPPRGVRQEMPNGGSPETPRVRQEMPNGGSPETPRVRQQVTPNKTHVEQDSENKYPPAPQASPRALSETDTELKVRRVFQALLPAFTEYYRYPPCGPLQRELYAAVEYHVGQGHEPTPEQVQRAVQAAQAEDREQGRKPRYASQLLPHLAEVLTAPPPTPKKSLRERLDEISAKGREHNRRQFQRMIDRYLANPDFEVPPLGYDPEIHGRPASASAPHLA